MPYAIFKKKIKLSPHATPTHFHFSTLSFYEIACE